MTQAEFAAAVGIGQSTLSQLERRKQDYTGEILQSIADFLRVTPADIIAFDPLPEFRADDAPDTGEGEATTDTPPFLLEVASILEPMTTESRMLAYDLLKAILQHQNLVEELHRPVLKLGLVKHRNRVAM